MVALPEKHSMARNTTVRLEELSKETYTLWPRHLSPGYDHREWTEDDSRCGKQAPPRYVLCRRMRAATRACRLSA
jgi:hypothetical protein